MRYSYVVFDIDGTLIDSENVILKSLQKTILEYKGIIKSYDELRFALGIPGKNALSKLGFEDLEEAEEKWNKYLTNYIDETALFIQIRQLVQVLKSNGVNLGIITSKTREEYKNDFFRFRLDLYFDVVICADDTKKHKPNKEPMEKYIEITNAKRSDIIYVGDSIYDIQCAKDAGVDSALALWGREDSEELEATYKLKNPNDILDVLAGKNQPNKDWLDWAIELQYLSQVGLAYSKDSYDLERFERIREISCEIVAAKTELNFEKVNDLFCNETGFQTPKLDTRAAIFKDSKILLVKESNTNTWALPGGWVDVNQSIYSNTIKEVKEESGLDVIPIKVIAIQDRNKHNIPRYVYGICKFFVLCQLIGGEFDPNIETSESKFFGLDELPKLALEKNNKEQINMCFLAVKDNNWETIFD